MPVARCKWLFWFRGSDAFSDLLRPFPTLSEPTRSATTIQLFSSPTVTYEGEPTGSAGGPGTYGKVDAAGHINSVAGTIAGFFPG